MKDFWITLAIFAGVGLFVASLVRYIFWLVYFSYTVKFLSIWGLFIVIGIVLGIIAQKYKVVSHLKDKLL